MNWIEWRDKGRNAVKKLLPQKTVESWELARSTKKYKRGLARNRAIKPDSKIPPLYNAWGESLDIFYLRDDHYGRNPYSRFARHFLWDRFNWGLDVHCYTGFHMFDHDCEATRRYGWLVESETIAFAEYEAIYQNPSVHREFDKVFTFSEKMLDTLPNAAFIPAGYVRYAHPWYDTATLDEHCYERKDRLISLVSSDKAMCPLHMLRMETAAACQHDPKLGVDVYGTFNGGSYAYPEQHLSAYRFSIAMENDIQKYFFTEKILNCFASMTIPVYLGGRGVTEFFREDGIIFINPEDCHDIGKITAQCTEGEYLSRLDAVKENYRRVQDYLAIENYMYKTYLAQDEYFVQREQSRNTPCDQKNQAEAISRIA